MEKLYKILPKYAFLPMIISIGFNAFVYFGTRPFTDRLYHYDLSIPLDHSIPIIPFFMIPYVLAYVTWILGFIIIGRESRQVCYEVMTAEQIAKVICLIFFIFLPAQIVRPEITGNSFSEQLTKLVYAVDEPNNLFPSIHCMLNWLLFRTSFYCKKVGKTYRIAMFFAALIIFASVLFTKQHLIVDIFGGILAAEFGLFVSKKWKIYRFYYKLEKKTVNYEKC